MKIVKESNELFAIQDDDGNSWNNVKKQWSKISYSTFRIRVDAELILGNLKRAIEIRHIIKTSEDSAKAQIEEAKRQLQRVVEACQHGCPHIGIHNAGDGTFKCEDCGLRLM